MRKTLILWTFYTAFIGVLVFGEINRTLSKTGDIDGELIGNAVEWETTGNHESGVNSNTLGPEDSAAPQLEGTVGHGNGECGGHFTYELPQPFSTHVFISPMKSGC